MSIPAGLPASAYTEEQLEILDGIALDFFAPDVTEDDGGISGNDKDD